MKKIIDIKDGILIDLKILAVKAGKDLKNFIQDLLEEKVNKERKGKKGSR